MYKHINMQIHKYIDNQINCFSPPWVYYRHRNFHKYLYMYSHFFCTLEVFGLFFGKPAPDTETFFLHRFSTYARNVLKCYLFFPTLFMRAPELHPLFSIDHYSYLLCLECCDSWGRKESDTTE